MPGMQNWAGSYEFRGSLTKPASVADLRELIARSAHVGVIGTRHSFHDIADSPEGVLVSLENLPRGVTVFDATEHRPAVAFVQGMISYGQLGAFLDRLGYAVRNLASLPHISVIGACATATHGSGPDNPSLASAVLSLEMIKADGSIVQLSRERSGSDFNGMVVALGALGVVTNVTLELVPRFDMRQYVYDALPVTQLQRRFHEIMSGAYSVSLFTDWQRDSINQVWVKALAGKDHVDLATLGATPADGPRHPVQNSMVDQSARPVDAQSCTQQLGVVGPWHERLPHFRLEFTPSVGEELQSEYILPSENFQRAFESIAELRAPLRNLIAITEIRTIAADSLWLNPAYRDGPPAGRFAVGIHFTWQKNMPGVMAMLPEIERRLTPLGARPHWGKLFTSSSADLHQLYPKMTDFRRLRNEFDPGGKFLNPFLDRTVMRT